MTANVKRAGLPQGTRFRILRRDDFTCRYCGASSPDVLLHIDHVVAVANGGGDEDDNLITACVACTLGKATQDGVIAPPPRAKLPASLPDGFAGLWALTFDHAGSLQYQVEILRRAHGNMWLVQYYSFLTGEPNRVGVMDGELLSDAGRCLLYPNDALMRAGYEKWCADVWGELRALPNVKKVTAQGENLPPRKDAPR